MAMLPSDFRIVTVGVLKTKVNDPYLQRIGSLHKALYHMAQEGQPDVCVIEKEFVGVNYRSALKLGEARGALISAVQRLNIAVEEVMPTEVKKAVTGYGHASKDQVNIAVKILLRFDKGNLPFDATDALAIALFYGMVVPFRRQAEQGRENLSLR